MLKCANCGSTAQLEYCGCTESDCGSVIEIYRCGCGAEIQRNSHRICDIYWSPFGTMICKKKYKEK